MKTWQLKFSKTAEKSLDRLDNPIRKRIFDFFEKKVFSQENPRIFAKRLAGKLARYYSYRIGEYRVIADILDQEITIFVVEVGHRREVYES